MKQKQLAKAEEFLKDEPDAKAKFAETKQIEVKAEQFVKNLALTGAEVANLKDKRFTIIGMPVYRSVPDLEHTGQMKDKLILFIELAQGQQQVEYYPNKTSWQLIAAYVGRDLKNWIGFTGEFYTVTQKVGKDLKEVIYIKEKKEMDAETGD